MTCILYIEIFRSFRKDDHIIASASWKLPGGTERNSTSYRFLISLNIVDFFRNLCMEFLQANLISSTGNIPVEFGLDSSIYRVYNFIPSLKRAMMKCHCDVCKNR